MLCAPFPSSPHSFNTQRDLVEQLKKAFSLTFNHRQPDPSLSRRRGALFMATQLFRLYFRLTNIRASQTLIDVRAYASARVCVSFLFFKSQTLSHRVPLGPCP